MEDDYESETENDENLEQQLDNDEMDANEAAFMQGYEDDEDDSFEEKEDKEEN